MSWKSYAAVSGATVLAGWLAATPPANAPDSAPAVSRQPVVRTTAPSDIEREAERLQLRVRHEIEYAQPRRNLFRFGERRPDVNGAGDTSEAVPVAAPPAAFVAPVPQLPPLKLAGIAEDQNGSQVERTAILSSPAGVLLVREGESAGEFRVGRIESEAVELVKDDGTTLRLMLSR